MPPENLEARVTALETQVLDLAAQMRATKADAAAARVLAGAADRDVTGIRDELRDFRQATTRSFHGLRQDMNDGFRRVDEQFARIDGKFAQVEGRFAQIDARFGQVDERFTQVDNGFAEMRAKFDMTAAGQQRIVELIQIVIDAQGNNHSA